MTTPSLVQVSLLAFAALCAGFIDAIAGGGGLITTPALLLLFPEWPVASILATTKGASLFGTAGAAVTYARRLTLPLGELLPGVLAALVAAWFGPHVNYLVEVLFHVEVRPKTIREFGIALRFHAQDIAAGQYPFKCGTPRRPPPRGA